MEYLAPRAFRESGARPELTDSLRRELAILARRPWARITEFSTERPSEWQPNQVRNPNGALDDHFTDASAWDLIASKLEEGHAVETVSLRHPPRKIGYVMKIQLNATSPILYVKLQLGSGKIIGRSFHYSIHE